MDYKSILKDSLFFPSKNWLSLLIFGLIYFTVHELYGLALIYPLDLFEIAIIGSLIIVWIIEMGFYYRVVSESIKGSKRPPKFNKLKNLFIHGFNANIVFGAYSIILLICYLMISSSLFFSSDVSGFIQLYKMNPEGIYTEKLELIKVIFVTTFSGLVYLWYLVALVNMANHKGSIRAGLDIKAIFRRIKKIGIINLILIYFYLDFFCTIFFEALAYTFDLIPFHVSHLTLSSILLSLIVMPYAGIFVFRLLGLFDKETNLTEIP